MKTIIVRSILAIALMVPALAADPGQAAPDFSVTDLKGKPLTSADLKGKVVVLEWVNFGCPFVKKHYASGNIPGMQKEYQAKGVVWITINSSAQGKQGYHDPAEMAGVATKEGHAAAHFVMDSSGTVGRAYDAKVTPHMIIIGTDGKIAYNGAIDSIPSTSQEDVAKADVWFKNALDAVLAGKPVSNAKNKPYGCGVKYGN